MTNADVAEAIFEATSDFKQIYRLSEGADRLWGRPICPEMRCPEHWLAWIHPDDRDRLSHFKTDVLQQKSASCEFRTIEPKGEVRWIQLQAWRLPLAQDDCKVVGQLLDITERKRSESRLRQREMSLAKALNCAKAATWDWYIDSGAIFCNERWAAMHCDTSDQTSSDIRTWENSIFPEDLPKLQKKLADHLAQHTAFFIAEYRILTRSGAMIWVLGEGSVIERDATGQPLRMIAIELVMSESSFDSKHQISIAATVFESNEGMLITDADYVVLRVNSAFSQISGYLPEEVVGRKLETILKSGQQKASFYEALWARIHDSGSWEGDLWVRAKNGGVLAVHLIVTQIKNSDGSLKNVVATMVDITQRKQSENEIKHLAYHDHLTGLPNRRLLMDRLQHSLASCARSGQVGALMFIDLDKFKHLNDTLGHDIGDLLLMQVAKRLESCMRKGDTVARLGGDEFAVVLDSLDDNMQDAADLMMAIGNKILTALNSPYQLARYTCRNKPSIGATLFHSQSGFKENLLKQADLAMYQAKTSGGNTLRFFDQQMQAEIDAGLALDADLGSALHGQQFELYFQRQTNPQRQAIGAEALIRWRHPKRGLIAPTDFIYQAEKSELILTIDQWVLAAACRQIGQWQQHDVTRHLYLAVNISVRQFEHPDFIRQISQILKGSAIDPSKLKLEIPESLMLTDDSTTLVKKMEALRTLGVHLSLHNFGKGSSALAALAQLPINQLKIDRALVHNIHCRPEDTLVVKTILRMASNLGIEVVAEGVEQESQAAYLMQHRCPILQGFLFGAPLPESRFKEQLVMN